MTNEELNDINAHNEFIEQLEDIVIAYIKSFKSVDYDQEELGWAEVNINKGFSALRRGLCGGKRTSDQV